MNQINVLFVYRGYFGAHRGTPLRIRSLINEIKKKDEFSVFTSSLDQQTKLNKNHLPILGNYFKDVLEISGWIKKNNIGIVVFHTLNSSILLFPLKFLNPKTKYVLEMHGFNEDESLLNKQISIVRYYRNKMLYSLIYRFCDSITTCSETASKILHKYNPNITTVFGGVDLDKFNPNITPVQSFREREGEIIIGYSGNARKWQGVDFLIDAFMSLLKRDDSYRLVLLLSEHLNLPKSSKITVLDSVPHEMVGGYNAAFDILVIPRPDNHVSRIVFPSKLMEYLAMGKPVVASKTSDIFEIISHGENGMLYTPGNIAEFIKCILELKEKSLRDKIGKRAFQTARDNYTWEQQGLKFANVLREVLIFSERRET